MKNILVPIDFSGESINALRVARQIAQKGNARLIVSHTIEFGDYANEPLEAYDALKNQLLTAVKTKVNELLQKENIILPSESIKIEINNTFSHILALIKNEKVNLVAMGSKGIRNWQAVSIGSITGKVIRYSTCPVLIVKEFVEIKDLQQITFASDLKNTPLRIIRALKDFQEVLGARIQLLKVNTRNNWGTERMLNQQIEEFGKRYEFENYSKKIYNDVEPEDGIIHYTEDSGAKLIAIAPHTKSDTSTIITDYRIAERVVENTNSIVWASGLGGPRS